LRLELGEDLGHRPLVVAARRGDPDLVPVVFRDPVGREDAPDPPAEPAPIRLDDVADALVRRPLVGRRSPARPVVTERRELGRDELAAGPQERGDLGRGERLEAVRRRDLGRVEAHHAPGVGCGGSLAPVAAAGAAAGAGARASAAAVFGTTSASAARPGWATSPSWCGGRTGRDRPPSASQHAAWWPAPTSNSGGSSTRQRSKAYGQRGWKRQPLGTCAASGVSPTRIVRFARVPAVGGSGDGETDTRACVYGLCGARMTRSAGPISMILPRYMTAIRSAITQASDRSWVMNR